VLETPKARPEGLHGEVPDVAPVGCAAALQNAHNVFMIKEQYL